MTAFRMVANDVSFEIAAAFSGKKVAASNSMVGTIAEGATGAIREAGDLLKTRGRKNIANAGFKAKWQNTWRVNIYPARGVSIDAAAFAFHKIPYSLIFEKGGTVAAKRGLLWLPLKTTPLKGIGKGKTTPKMLEAKGVKLFTIRRPGKAPLLAANVPASKSGTRRTARMSLSRVRTALMSNNALKEGATRSIPLFFGVPSVRIKKKFDLAGVADGVRAEMGELYFKHVNPE